MSYYLDTSVIAAYYCPEPLSDRAEDFLTSHAHPGISLLTELELFSALSRKVREGGLDQSGAGRVAARILSHLLLSVPSPPNSTIHSEPAPAEAAYHCPSVS